MKNYTRTLFSFASILSILIASDCFAASYEEIFRQFLKENRVYSSYQLLTSKQPASDSTSFLADRGDVDGDGLEEVIFAMRKDNAKTSQRIVILKGVENNQFKTILINQPMTSAESSYNTLYIDKEHAHFSVSSHSGGFVLQDGPGSSKTIEFGLSGTKLPIKRLSFSSPWRTESAAPAHSYTYNFGKGCYVQEWEAVEYNPELKEGELVGKVETGRFSLKNNKKALYVDNSTDPFSTKDQRAVVPGVIEGRVIKTSDQQAGSFWEC